MSIKSSLGRQLGTQFDAVFDVVKSNPIYDKSGGKIPTLDLNFAKTKSLFDGRSTKNKITFSRASTATYVDGDGVIQSASVDEARFDHDPATGESLGLLIEEERTNRINNSNLETGANGFWQSFSPEGATATWTADSIASPDGTVSAGLAQKNNGGNPRFINSVNIVGANTVLIASVFCKQYQTEEVLQLSFYNIAGVSYSQAEININSASATLGTGFSDAVVEDFDNSWKRVSVKYTVPSSATGTTATFSVQPSSNTSGMYLWGSQVEVGSFLTSLIITSGSTATRAADVAEITGTNFSSFFNQTEGTVFVETSTPLETQTIDVQISVGTNNNKMELRSSGTSLTVAKPSIRVNGVTRFGSEVNAGSGSFRKLVLGYKKGKNAFACDGNISTSNTNFNLPTVNKLRIGDEFVNADRGIGHIKRLIHFNTRLSNTILQTITA